MKTKLLAVVMIAASILIAGCAGYRGGCPWTDMGMMGYYGFGGVIMWILVIVLVAVVVYLIVQSSKIKSPTGAQGESPLDILKKRYAKGEITKEEFESMKKDIQ
jgi:putative membrane protein